MAGYIATSTKRDPGAPPRQAGRRRRYRGTSGRWRTPPFISLIRCALIVVAVAAREDSGAPALAVQP
jgi:hypothetical protein